MSEQKLDASARIVNCTIYGLIDPNTGLLRYVGKTTRPLRTRLISHCNDAYHCRRTAWVRSLRRKGQRPRIVSLEVVPNAESDDAEISMIAFIRSTGAELLNGTDGGDGMKNATPETRAKMSASRRKQPVNWNAIAAMKASNTGRNKSEETRARMAKAQKKSKSCPSVRRQISDRLRGHAVSEETRAKISAKVKGFRHTDDAKRKIGEASRRPHSLESRIKSSISNKLTWARRQREKEANAGQLFILGE